MTTTRSRREEYSSSNVVRVLHPSRPLSPQYYNKSINHSNNSNIDYLIDDLQQSVSRPGSSLGNEEVDNISQRQMSTKTMREVQYLNPANSTTVVRERSSSPNSKHERVYKTANYEYSTSSNGLGQAADDVKQNISQLDNLLMDLKHERDTSLERERRINVDSGIDSGLIEPGSSVTKTTRTYTTNRSNSGSRLPTNRELIFDSPDGGYGTTVTTTTTTESRGRPKSPSFEKHIKTRIERDVEYDIIPTRDRYPEKDKYLTNSSTKSYSSNNYSTISSTAGKPVAPYTETNKQTVTHIDSSILPPELKDIPLSSDILPGPGTKVTTTIKTYTYEIPGEPENQTNKTIMYKNESYNTTSRSGTDSLVNRPISPAPGGRSVYRNEFSEYKNDSTTNYVPPPTTGPSKTIFYKETNETTDTKSYPGGPHGAYPPPVVHSHPPSSTVIYKEDVRNTTNTHYPPHGGPYYPSGDPPTGPKKTYFYKNEKSTTKNTVYGPPGSRQPSEDYPNNALPAPTDYPDYPGGPNTSYYKYTTKTTTKNSYGAPNEPQPMPFPTDGVEYVQEVNPPKRLDDLLASFDNTDKKSGPVIEEYTPRREVNTSVASEKPVDIPSKNIAGPAVYYPPGKEIVKSEEEGAAWRAQGGYAKARGNYMYEADAKSKSKSKKGGAIVPVCLPLCCAMPCSIM